MGNLKWERYVYDFFSLPVTQGVLNKVLPEDMATRVELLSQKDIRLWGGRGIFGSIPL